MKHKCDHAKETGGGPAALDFTEDENVMYRIMGNGAVLNGIDGGVDTAESTEPSQATQPEVTQSNPMASITPQAVTLVINMEVLPPKVLLEKTKALLHARQLALSHTLPKQHVVPSSKANGKPITTLPLDESPNTAAAVPQNNPVSPQELQTPGTSDAPQGMRVQSICDAQEAIPHLRTYNVTSNGMSFQRILYLKFTHHFF